MNLFIEIIVSVFDSLTRDMNCIKKIEKQNFLFIKTYNNIFTDTFFMLSISLSLSALFST